MPLAVTDVGVPGAAPAGIDACSQPVSYESTNLDPCDATTSTVSLRIDGVTAAPVREFTAISEVAVHGA